MLGADDGVVSTASMMLGVAAASASRGSILIAGVAGLVAGAMSMGAGEYVSVSSQHDAEEADIAVEQRELASDPRSELEELAGIYRRRGLDPDLAMQVARQLSAKDKLAAHLRDELGIEATTRARPLQAGLVSAASYASLAIVPILTVAFSPEKFRVILLVAISLASLAILGAIGSHLGGAPKLRGALRVSVGGGAAMGVTALVGHLVGGVMQ